MDHRGQGSFIMYHGTTKFEIMRHDSSTDGMPRPERYPLNPKPGERLAVLKLKVNIGINLLMDKDFLSGLRSLGGLGGHRYYIMYHGTTLEAAKQIKLHGFRCSDDGMLGPGVYVSRSVAKAKRYPLNPPPGEKLAILKLKVRVGKVKKIDKQGHPLQKTWHDEGYDTAWVPPNCGMVKSSLEEECVWDPSRIEVLEMWKVERNDKETSYSTHE
ncbi:uncharacterized protein LOC113648486 [Tachysurus fulvidraco]|uniref:uncharacterized protein LOC113648486 n=1 Tax=Tachysurus fulvidraco TaxID=1234273 RepID=UPI000F4EAC22|nr:uncharacterized protein LOC113648486 [Tachysurus fulvidraco]XP_027011501.1 uncharacterized protein LOC113648486 [Tachysurus fulvidraco]XP_027011503.1 uncharacterized protein LOC113648486 [Tachysurus fulvidraco]